MLSTSSPIYATGGEPEKILVYSEFIGVRLVKLEQIRRVIKFPPHQALAKTRWLLSYLT